MHDKVAKRWDALISFLYPMQSRPVQIRTSRHPDTSLFHRSIQVLFLFRQNVRMHKMVGAEGDADGSIYLICDRGRVPKATTQIAHYHVLSYLPRASNSSSTDCSDPGIRIFSLPRRLVSSSFHCSQSALILETAISYSRIRAL